MKKISLLIFGSIISLLTFSQNDSLITISDTCKPWKNLELENIYRCEMDTNWRMLYTSDIPEDDTSFYPNFRTGNKTEFHELRLIYFLHGLGGSDASWNAVHDAHDQEYRYYAARPDYSGGWTSGASSQRDFKLASKVTQQKLDDWRASFLANLGEDGIEYGLPYLIAHSQGGLIARDLDMKYATGYDNTYLPSNRRFHGFITVGTPNAGALIAVNQTSMDNFVADMSNRLAAPIITQQMVNIALKIPFYSKHRVNIVTKTQDLLEDISDFLGKTMLAQLTKAKRDPITEQYGPDAPYLNNELNHSTTNIPKAAFYGIEEDPIFWRIATYMIGKDASEYPLWGANDDSDLGENMENLRIRYLLEEQLADININKTQSRINKSWRFGFIGIKKLTQDLALHKKVKDAFNEGAEFLKKANLSYKVIIGAVDPNNLYRVETVGYRYRCVTNHFNWILFNRLSPSSQAIVRNNPILMKQYYYKASRTVTNPNDCKGEIISSRPIRKYVLNEIPSDATVTAPSQRALPGTDREFVREINEIIDHSNPYGGTVIYKSNVNHIQMRNCAQTDAMLRRIYDGRGVPSFFRLERY